MTVGFRARYRKAFRNLLRPPVPRDGFTLNSLVNVEERLGVRLPRALRDYYLTIGRHKLNQANNRLLMPRQLYVDGEHLIFMEENQVVVLWGIRCEDLKEPNPTVYQAANADTTDWYSEDASCSEFLLVMLYWQAVSGGFPYCGCAERVDPKVVKLVERSWPLIAHSPSMSAYGKSGQAVCVLPEGKSVLIQVGARTRRDYRAIEEDLKIPLNEA